MSAHHVSWGSENTDEITSINIQQIERERGREREREREREGKREGGVRGGEKRLER